MCIISECCSINTGMQCCKIKCILTLSLPYFSSSDILSMPCFLNEMLLYFTCRRCLLSLQLVKWDSSFTTRDKGKSWKTEKSDFHSWHNQKFFLFLMSRLALKPIQPPTKWALGPFLWGKMTRAMKPTTHLQLLPRSRKH